MVRSDPVAIFFCCARSKASTGRCSPAFNRWATEGTSSSAIVKITVIGWICVMTSIPFVSAAWTMFPGSTRRRPTRPEMGDVMRQ